MNRVSFEEVPVLHDADDDRMGRIWVHRPLSAAAQRESAIALLALRDGKDRLGSQEVNAYLDRAMAQRVIDALQELLDAAGPEPIPVPECDGVIDTEHDKWYREDDGTFSYPYRRSNTPYGGVYAYSHVPFAELLAHYKRLVPFRSVERTVTDTIELDTVTA